MFPNRHAVYLHDTPNRRLFAGDKRAFSHGCVRLDQPFRLRRVRARPGMDRGAPASLIGKGERTIQLPEKIPVHITYFTLLTSTRRAALHVTPTSTASTTRCAWPRIVERPDGDANRRAAGARRRRAPRSPPRRSRRGAGASRSAHARMLRRRRSRSARRSSWFTRSARARLPSVRCSRRNSGGRR